jgi:hypothetical protein
MDQLDVRCVVRHFGEDLAMEISVDQVSCVGKPTVGFGDVEERFFSSL